MVIRYIFSIFIILTLVQAEFNTTALDKYHTDLSDWLVDTSNSIDDYLTESNGTQRSKTYAELKTSFAVENTQASEYAIRLKLRLDLPKIQKELRIVFEDATSDDALYDGTVLNSDYHLEERSYFLRLDYFKYIKKQLNLSMGTGIRFRKASLHPYLNLKANYKLHKDDREKVLISNRFRLYIDGDTENILAFKRLYDMDNSYYYTFNNTLRYRSWENSQKIVNDISILKVLATIKQVKVGVSLISDFEDTSIRADYYKLYGTYRDLLYKDWIYYELTPSFMRRAENHFNTSYRFMVNFGMIFKTN